jgi:hypothetical protein
MKKDVLFFIYDNSEHNRSCRLCSMHVLEWATSTRDEWIAKPEHDDVTRLFLASESRPTSCTMCTTCC